MISMAYTNGIGLTSKDTKNKKPHKAQQKNQQHYFKNWAEDLNKILYKEDTKMANWAMKRCSATFLTVKM